MPGITEMPDNNPVVSLCMQNFTVNISKPVSVHSNFAKYLSQGKHE